MSRYAQIWTGCLLGLAFCVPGIGAAADPTAAKAAAKVLLEKGWDKTAAAKALPDHPKLQEPGFANDSMVLAARWLVFMNQGRYDDALAALEKFLQANPTDDLKLSALRAKAWILTVKKNYRLAMVVADQLSEAANPNPPVTDPEIRAAQDDAIVFVARLVGFVEGPCEKTADQTVRAKLEERVLQRIDEARKKVFIEAKTGVLDQFKDLLEDAAAAKQDSKQAAEVAKQVQLEQLSGESAKLSEDAGKVEDQGKKLAEEVKKRMDELTRMDASLAQRLFMLQGQLTTLNSSLEQQRSLVRAYTTQSTKGGSSSSTNLPALTRAQNEVANLQGQINMTNNEMALVQTRRGEVQQTMVATGGAAQMQSRLLEGKLQDLERNKLKNENKQKRTEKKKVGAPSKALALETEARAFSTYDEFPLEEVRSTLMTKLQ